MKYFKKKKYFVILVLTILLSLIFFIFEQMDGAEHTKVVRNGYGEGKKIESYELKIGNETETIDIEVGEREYNHEEIQKVFDELLNELDQIVLGENESWDRVEKDLQLISYVEDYPVQIQWELSSYNVVSMDGTIQDEGLVDEGTLIELRGILTYGEESAVYVRNARIFPPSGTNKEKLLYEVKREVKKEEENTRGKAWFSLPQELSGQKLEWKKKRESKWYFVLILGVGVMAYLLYREWKRTKQKDKEMKDELLREYPGLISKFTMLLGTGATVKNTWEKIVQSQEERGIVAKEMKMTLQEMKSGISEMEAYERFGKRCQLPVYLKFGTLLSQNVRKGGKGLSSLIQVEAMQAFEERKSIAKRHGEEAGAKLLMPMLGMLLVVLVMVMFPAFLNMQL